MKTAAAAGALLVITALAGCGTSDSGDSEGLPAAFFEGGASDGTLVPCTDFKVGARITAAMEQATETGCDDVIHGITLLSTAVVEECSDGRTLLEHSDVLFGFTGGTWQRGGVNDAAYVAAARACSS